MHLKAEKNANNKDSQTGQVTPKKYLKKLDTTYFIGLTLIGNDVCVKKGNSLTVFEKKP